MKTDTNCRKCGSPCSRSMTVLGIGPVCYTCFQNHKDKSFWEKLHGRIDKRVKTIRDAKSNPNQRTLNDIRIKD
jgi:hypothetical protein